MRNGRDDGRLIFLNLAAAAAVVIGLVMLQGSDVAFSPAGALAGLGSQLSTTLPAAILVLAATAANLLVGSILVRLIRRRPFASAPELALSGLVGAVIFDTAALMLFGGLGLFIWPVIAALHVAGLAGLLRARPLLVRPRVAGPRVPAGAWLLIGLAWSAPVLVQLASPVVPFIDVLPNHVAPVEHLRTFGSYETLTTAPSPIYGPSRMFLGYVGLLGMLSTLTTLPAALTVAAFTLPMTILVALGVQRLTSAVFGRRAAYWALLAAPLSVVFLRLPDARATVLVFPILSVALALAVELSARRRGDRASDAHGAADLLLGASLGAAILVHPAMGALATGTVFLLALFAPGLAPAALVGLVVAAGLALPQGALMLGADLPAWAGLGALALAGLAGLAARRASVLVRLPPVTVLSVPALVLVLGLLVWAPNAVPALARVLSDVASRFPLLLVVVILGIALTARRARWQLPVAAAVVWVAAGVLAQLLPAGSLIADSIRFEMPKTLAYWWSWIAVGIAAVVLADAWRARGALGPSGPVLATVFVLVAVLPLREEPVGPNDHNEYRISESMSVALHHVERGYWVGYPDSRMLVNAEQQELLDALRREIAEGRLGHDTRVLHLAGSFQQWASIPLGVFAGVIETDVTLDPEDSIHTVGGRLHGFNELESLLATDAYAYVVLEPAGLQAGLRDTVVAAGYESIFANARGEIFRAPLRN